MAVHTSPLALYQTQVARFTRLGMTMLEGHSDIASGGLDDWKKLTAGGVGPQGHARVKWLRDAGHPFARSGGLKRGIAKSRRKKAGMSAVPNLPIGRISGRLHRTLSKRPAHGGIQSFDVGTTQATGGAMHVLRRDHPKMVDRGFFMVEKRNWRARNKAFQDVFVRRQRQP